MISVLVCVVMLALPGGSPRADDRGSLLVVAQGTEDMQPTSEEEMKLPPEERMRRRFPQPVKVRDLIGLPVLDWDDITIGYVRSVVRTPAGKTQLIMTYGGWFGWGQRLVAVPLETVAILGRQLAALDIKRAEFDKAPTWSDSQGMAIPPGEMIRIAITRR